MPAPRAIASVLTPPGVGGIAVIALTGPDAERIAESLFEPLARDPAGCGAADRPLCCHPERSEAKPSAVEGSPAALRDRDTNVPPGRCPGALGDTRAMVSGEADGHDRLRLGRIVVDGQVLDEALLARTPRGMEINLHGGSASQRAVLRALSARGAAIEPAAGDALLPATHPTWRNPAIGRELLAVLPTARGRLATRWLAWQWSDGLSRIAAEERAAPGSRRDELRAAAAELPRMQRLLSQADVVLAGPPNAGKSTLANALVGREVSIVSDRPGTTRDWTRAPAEVDGVPIEVTDTAGLWESATGVDAEAVRRAWSLIGAADLVLLISDGAPVALPPTVRPRRVLHVRTKTDRAAPSPPSPAPISVSAVTGHGLDALSRAIAMALDLGDIRPDLPACFTPRQADLATRAANGDPQAVADLLGRT